MFKVLFTKGFQARLTEVLSPHCEIDYWREEEISRRELLERVKGVHAVICNHAAKIDSELLDSAGPQLKVIGTHSVGLEHIDLVECKTRGVKVGYTPGVLDDAVAETTIGMMIAAGRNYKTGCDLVSRGCMPDWNQGRSVGGQEIGGSSVGIFGLGRIGLAIARKLSGFKPARIIYHNRSENPQASEVDAEYVSFEELLIQSDFLVASCSVNPSNQKTFNKEAFLKMKKTAVFVNVCRGSIVDQDGLCEVLKNRDIYAAGLDVTTPQPLPRDHPLLSLDNCFIQPHFGTATAKTRWAMCDLTARNVLAGLLDQELPAPAPDA